MDIPCLAETHRYLRLPRQQSRLARSCLLWTDVTISMDSSSLLWRIGEIEEGDNQSADGWKLTMQGWKHTGQCLTFPLVFPCGFAGLGALDLAPAFFRQASLTTSENPLRKGSSYRISIPSCCQSLLYCQGEQFWYLYTCEGGE
jgi:hypothetical protein